MSAEHQEKKPGAYFVKFEDLTAGDVQKYLPGWELKLVQLQDILPLEALEPFEISLPNPDARYTGGGLTQTIKVNLGKGLKGTPYEVVEWEFSQRRTGHRYDRNKFTIFPSSRSLYVVISSKRADGPDIYNNILLDMPNIEKVKLDSLNGRITFISEDASYQIMSNGRHLYVNKHIPMRVGFTSS